MRSPFSMGPSPVADVRVAEIGQIAALAYHTITEMLQTAAELITLKPKDEWASWIQFLLSELQSITPAQSYVDLLAQLQEAIAGQLAELAN